MAILFCDGFDHSGTTMSIHVTKYTSAVSLPTLVTSPVRTGAGSMRISSGAGLSLSKHGFAIPSGTLMIFGSAFQRSGNESGNRAIVTFQEGSGTTSHLGLGLTATGQLFVFLGTTGTILATGATTIPPNGWFYIEFKAVIHDTTGSYEVRIDSATELSATGIDTRNGGATGTISGFIIGAGNASNWHHDDLYFLDGTGPAPRQNFLGPVKIETLLPQTDAVAAGSNAGLTPSTGTDHGALVDEVPPNTTDYNGSPTVGLKDTYQYPSLTIPGQVLAVQTTLYLQKSDAVARQVCVVVRSGGVDFDGPNIAPLTTFAYMPEIRAQDPSTAADWTQAGVNAVQVGMKVTA